MSVLRVSWNVMTRRLYRCVARDWVTKEKGCHVARPKEWSASRSDERVETTTISDLSNDDMKEVRRFNCYHATAVLTKGPGISFTCF